MAKRRGGGDGSRREVTTAASRPPADPPGTQATQALRFSKVNALLAVSGLVAVVAGYFLLGAGSITAAPILLVLGYVILLPLAIIL